METSFKRVPIPSGSRRNCKRKDLVEAMIEASKTGEAILYHTDNKTDRNIQSTLANLLIVRGYSFHYRKKNQEEGTMLLWCLPRVPGA
jgi:hypothetical protein